MPKPINQKEDLDELNVLELKAFLDARGVRKTGLKPELLRLARLYFRSGANALSIV